MKTDVRLVCSTPISHIMVGAIAIIDYSGTYVNIISKSIVAKRGLKLNHNHNHISFG